MHFQILCQQNSSGGGGGGGGGGSCSVEQKAQNKLALNGFAAQKTHTKTYAQLMTS